MHHGGLLADLTLTLTLSQTLITVVGDVCTLETACLSDTDGTMAFNLRYSRRLTADLRYLRVTLSAAPRDVDAGDEQQVARAPATWVVSASTSTGASIRGGTGELDARERHRRCQAPEPH